MTRASACGSSWLSVESRRVALATIATPSRADAPRRRPVAAVRHATAAEAPATHWAGRQKARAALASATRLMSESDRASFAAYDVEFVVEISRCRAPLHRSTTEAPRPAADVELYSSTALQSALQLYSSTALYTLHPLHPPSGAAALGRVAAPPRESSPWSTSRARIRGLSIVLGSPPASAVSWGVAALLVVVHDGPAAAAQAKGILEQNSLSQHRHGTSAGINGINSYKKKNPRARRLSGVSAGARLTAGAGVRPAPRGCQLGVRSFDKSHEQGRGPRARANAGWRRRRRRGDTRCRRRSTPEDGRQASRQVYGHGCRARRLCLPPLPSRRHRPLNANAQSRCATHALPARPPVPPRVRPRRYALRSSTTARSSPARPATRPR